LDALILERQQHSGWGAKIIDRLAGDLRDAYPDMKGFSPRNLKYMRAFSAHGLIEQLCKHPLHKSLGITISRCWRKSPQKLIVSGMPARLFNMAGASPSIVLQIKRNAHRRHGKAVSNFKSTLPPVESDMAAHVFKDPYLFDYGNPRELRLERKAGHDGSLE
jgi:predicted nuclease of restriction endonuclease-like (RecB) superfamily